MPRKFYFFLLLTLILTSSGLAGTYLASQIHAQELRELKSSQRLILSQNVQQAEILLAERLSDISFISDQLERHKSWTHDTISPKFIDYCNNFPSIFQVRMINHLGNEVVRVQRNSETKLCEAAPEEMFQNKLTREYFWQSMSLPVNAVFVSSLELNMEGGEIELPHRPIIRFAKKLLNPANNEPVIVIINTNALEDLRELLKPQDGIEGTSSFILDARGGVVSGGGILMGGKVTGGTDTMPTPHAHIEGFSRIVGGLEPLPSQKGIFLHQQVKMPNNQQTPMMISDVSAKMPWTFVRWISPEVIASQSPLTPQRLPYITIGWILASGLLAWLLTSRRSKIIALKASEHNHKLASSIDPLTNISNRRKLEDVLESEHQRFVRYKTPLSVVMIDVDNFKSINDEFGHDIGDKTLQELAKMIEGNIRETDHAGRYGGEEFLVVCPNTKIQQARLLAEKLRASCEAETISGVGTITLSIGVAEAQAGDARGMLDPLKRADEAMYEAKRKGKNRVEILHFASPEEGHRELGRKALPSEKKGGHD